MLNSLGLEDTAADGRRRITGKGADLVGPYTLSGKALGNKVSMIKTYCGQGNQVTDIGHVVTMRLIRLDNQQIFDGMYYVNTDEVHTNGIYQIWPVGYDKENNVLPVPPETSIEEMPVDIENQPTEPLPDAAVASGPAFPSPVNFTTSPRSALQGRRSPHGCGDLASG